MTYWPQIGGATGLVGDPSGRTTERQMAETAQIELNTSKLSQAIHKFFDSAATYVEDRLSTQSSTLPAVQVLNNLTWLKDVNLLDFLRTTGTHFRVNNMLTRDRYASGVTHHHHPSDLELAV